MNRILNHNFMAWKLTKQPQPLKEAHLLAIGLQIHQIIATQKKEYHKLDPKFKSNLRI